MEETVEQHFYKCPLCVFVALTIPLVLSHLRLVHSSDPNISVVCGIGGCYMTAKSFSALSINISARNIKMCIIQSRCNSSSQVATTSVDTHSSSLDTSLSDSIMNGKLCLSLIL